MRVLVLGGDGFCGWPTVLHLSRAGHDVTVVDSLVRREIDRELGTTSLTPITSPETRLAAWREVGPAEVGLVRLDVAVEYDALLALLQESRPDAVVHLAEQRSAPYSMRDAAHKRATVDANLNATHNLLAALVEARCDAHLVHLGTMGVYGYETAALDLPEGYLPVTYADRDGRPVEREILFPTRPGSVYHLTKSLDQLLFQFYAANDGVRITDLHQGIVWGTQTDETRLDPRLVNRFDYDGDFGTVLNRFLVEAVSGLPLTVHGTGGQTRAFIHLQDTVRCIRLAVESGDRVRGRVRIMNQVAETHRVRDLARLVERLLGAEISWLPNPRQEAAENDLAVRTDLFRDLGLRPLLLEEGLLRESAEVACAYADRVDPGTIPATACWNDERRAAVSGERR